MPTKMISLFFACRVLATKPGRRDYLIFQGEELTRRHDVEVASKGFATEEAATVEIKRLRGSIPDDASPQADHVARRRPFDETDHVPRHRRHDPPVLIGTAVAVVNVGHRAGPVIGHAVHRVAASRGLFET